MADNIETAPSAGAMIPEIDWERRAVDHVLDDFDRAKKFLDNFHTETMDRFEHYYAPQVEENIKKKRRRKFPVPFTTEQVDTLKAKIKDKIFYKNRPCSIYGREKTDEGDAEAKRALFEYQDQIDEIESKIDQGITVGAISGIIPMQINYEERFTTDVIEVPVPVTDDDGNPLIGEDGMPVVVGRPQAVKVPQYKGAVVELIDVLDFFFTPEKRNIDDGEPIIIRSMRRPRFFKSKPYFFNQENIRKRDARDVDSSEKTIQRRERIGLLVDQSYYAGHCTYLEWQGWYDPGDDVTDNDDNEYRAGYYVIGVITGASYEDILVRFDGPKGEGGSPFPFEGPNVVVGCLLQEPGELMGARFVDKFHAVQHAQDSLMGAWFANLKQLIKRPKIVNSDAIINPDQINTLEDEVIEVETREDVNRAIAYVNVPNISPDVYAGLEMLRMMGQNASRIHDIAEGKVQKGVETLGEADILTAAAEVGINDYLKALERTLIRPLYEKRNAINAAYLDLEYVFWVIGEKGLEWRKIQPAQIRAEVDFVCEASTREARRAVLAQQVLQSLQPLMSLQQMYAQSGYPPQVWPRVDLLIAELFEQWTWSQDKIEKILPSILMEENMPMQAPPMPMQAVGGQGGQGGGMPQPRSEGQAIASAQQRNQTQIGRV